MCFFKNNDSQFLFSKIMTFVSHYFLVFLINHDLHFAIFKNNDSQFLFFKNYDSQFSFFKKRFTILIFNKKSVSSALVKLYAQWIVSVYA